METRYIIAVLLSVTALTAQQEAGGIQGKVVSSRDGEPLGLVQIQLTDTNFRAVTQDDGTFKIEGIPPGKYVLQAAAAGYQLRLQEFTLTAGEAKNVDLVLTSSTAQRKDTVDVTAGAFGPDVNKSASSITLEGDERKNLASVLADDPLRAVQSLPGVTSNNDFSSEFSLRGAPFQRVGLYLDGVLLHSPFHTTDGQTGNGSLTIFNGDMVDDMTLFQGAWPVLYSGRTAGVLAVESREGDRQEIHARISASASNAGLLAEGPLGKRNRGSWLIAFRKSYLQYILNRIDFGDEAPLTFGFIDGEARLTYDLSPRHTLSLSLVDGASSVDRSAFRSSLGVNTVMKSDFHFTFLNLGSRYAPNQKLLVTNHVALTRDPGSVANRDDANLASTAYQEWTWRGDASIVWNGKHSTEFGGQFRRSRDDGGATRLVYTPVLVSVLDAFRGSSREGGAYAQQSFALAAGRMHASLGLRRDASSASTVSVTSPYASLALSSGKKTRLQMDWGQYAQFPELNQYFSVFTRGHLLPERATHYEAALEQNLDDRTRLRVEFYDRQDRDLLATPFLDPRLLQAGSIFNAVPNAPLRNTERGYSRGAQVFLQRRTANGFTGWVSYAYGRAMLSDGDLQARFASDYDQRHTFNAYGSRRIHPTLNVSARFTYGSGMPFPGFYQIDPGGYSLSLTRNALRAPAFERTDLRLNKAFVHKKSKTTLFAEIVNITNHHNRDFDSPGPYDATGRTYPKFFSMFPILPSAGMVMEF